MRMRSSARGWIGLSCLLMTAQMSQAGDLAWTGPLLLVADDSGAGAYTGGIEGQSRFMGTVLYPDVCGPTCLIEPFPPDATNYVFSNGSGTLIGLGEQSEGIESSIEIINDQVVTPDAVALAALYDVALTAGSTIDVWVVSSENDGEFTPDFVTWSVSYVYATTNPFANTSLTPTPPANPDFIMWEIDEDEGDAYAAIGEVTSVPEPAMMASLLMGVLSLTRQTRRRLRTSA